MRCRRAHSSGPCVKLRASSRGVDSSASNVGAPAGGGDTRGCSGGGGIRLRAVQAAHTRAHAQNLTQATQRTALLASSSPWAPAFHRCETAQRAQLTAIPVRRAQTWARRSLWTSREWMRTRSARHSGRLCVRSPNPKRWHAGRPDRVASSLQLRARRFTRWLQGVSGSKHGVRLWARHP